jgi:hypothetical protein
MSLRQAVKTAKPIDRLQVNFRGIAQMVARVVWDHEAAGSSPATPTKNKREWLSGRASPCQGERREFESRLPLQYAGMVQW